MRQEPLQALQAASRPLAPAPRQPRLLIAGATGVLGNEVLRRLAGGGAYADTQVLAREPITAGLRGVQALLVAGDDPAVWPATQADAGVILFDPPRLFHDRERALWTPEPHNWVAVARWLRASGCRTLAVVLPHAPGRLPEALKRGLAGLDEHEVAAAGFDRLLFIRSAQKPGAAAVQGSLRKLAAFMLSVFKYMVPSTEQPVRAAKVAEFVAAALREAPPGIHVAAPERVWQAAQGDVAPVVRDWLGRPK